MSDCCGNHKKPKSENKEILEKPTKSLLSRYFPNLGQKKSDKENHGSSYKRGKTSIV